MKHDLRLGLLAAIAAIIPGIVLTAFGLPTSIVIVATVGAGVAVVVALGRRWYRRIIDRMDQQTTHLRAAVGVAATSRDLPVFWSEHAVTPETVTLIQSMIVALNVRRVLELGSGLSTVLIANSFRRTGDGSVLSFDDDERWAALTNATLRRENLDAFAEVRVAPLVKVASGGRTAPWYDLSGLDATDRFDMIIVDGPPAWRGDSLARLPALYELRSRLSENGVLVLDDAARGGETQIGRRWRHDFPEMHYRMVNVGRGLFVASVAASTLDLLPAQ